MTGFCITCPMCGGAVTPWGWTAAGNQTGQCAYCYESVIVTAHASYGAGRINRAAPFFPLVEMVDDVSREIARPSTGTPQALRETIG